MNVRLASRGDGPTVSGTITGPAYAFAAVVLATTVLVLSRDARAVLSLSVPHLGGVDGLLSPLLVARVVVLAVLLSTLLRLSGLPVARPSRQPSAAVAGSAGPVVSRLVLVGRVSATVLVLMALLETFGAAALAPSGGAAGRADPLAQHVTALVGSVWVLLSLLRPVRTVTSSAGWSVLVLAATHVPLALSGSWTGQPGSAGGAVAVVSRASWLLAVLLLVGPVLVRLLVAARDGRTPASDGPSVVLPAAGVVLGGYGALLAMSTAPSAPATSMLVVAGVTIGAVAVLVLHGHSGRGAGLGVAALAALAGLTWLLLQPATDLAAAPEGAAAGAAHGMDMGSTGAELARLDTQAWVTQWTWDPLFAPLALVASAAYLLAVTRLRRAGHRWPAVRTVAWVVGWGLFAWATNGAPAVYGMALFSMHMVQHMTISMAAPAFLVLASPVSLAFRALSPRRDGGRGAREWLMTLVHSRLFRLVANPLVAPPFFVVSLMVFYYSPLFELAMASYAGHVLMTVHFLLSGYLFAWVLVGTDPGPSRPPYPLRLMILIITMAFHAFFGIVLMSSDVILAEDWFRAAAPPWADLAQDQYVGGALAWGLGDYPVAVLSVALAFAWLRDDDREQRRYDRQADRDGDAALAAYNRYLQSLGQPGRGQDHRPDTEERS